MTKRLTLRMSDETFDAIESIAERYRITKSDVVRMTLEDRLTDLPTTTISRDDYLKALRTIDSFKSALSQVDASVVKMGVNLNQITRVINQQKGVTQDQLSSVIRMTKNINNVRSYIHEMSERVNKLVGRVTQD